jgi:predicted Zn-dependent protease with MMP-like domain
LIDVPRERFEELVGDALDGIPEGLGKHMENVWVGVEDRAPGPLLGLYEGIPLTERAGGGYGGGGGYIGSMPDRITIYRLPICGICSSEEEVVNQVRRTVVHEVAHHFGIDDERLSELGWA